MHFSIASNQTVNLHFLSTPPPVFASAPFCQPSFVQHMVTRTAALGGKIAHLCAKSFFSCSSSQAPHSTKLWCQHSTGGSMVGGKGRAGQGEGAVTDGELPPNAAGCGAEHIPSLTQHAPSPAQCCDTSCLRSSHTTIGSWHLVSPLKHLQSIYF